MIPICGRFTLTLPFDAIAERFSFQTELDWQPRYNIAPSQSVLAVIEARGERRAGFLRWGLIPSWAKDPSFGKYTINARAESVTTKPAFRSAIVRRRCLIPADSFYEWYDYQGKKTAVRIHLPDQPVFALAGLWERWRGPEEEIVSCTIITTSANEQISTYHHRMPVILPDAEAEQAWLDPDAPKEEVLDLLRPYTGHISAHHVSNRVNSPRFDDPACIEPLQESES